MPPGPHPAAAPRDRAGRMLVDSYHSLMRQHHDMIEHALSARLAGDAGLAELLSDLPAEDATFLVDWLDGFATDRARTAVN